MQKHGKRKPTDIMGPQTLTPTLSVCLTVCQGSMRSCLPPGASLLQPVPDHTTDSPGQKTQPAPDLNSQGPLGLSGGPTVRNTFYRGKQCAQRKENSAEPTRVLRTHEGRCRKGSWVFCTGGDTMLSKDGNSNTHCSTRAISSPAACGH